LRNPDNRTPKNFIDSLKHKGVTIEPVRNKQDIIYGIRFRYDGETFKASEIGKEFGLCSLFRHYGQRINENQVEPKHFEKPQLTTQQQPQNRSSVLENTISAVDGLSDIQPSGMDYDPDEAELTGQ
jgi:hypothetical protein